MAGFLKVCSRSHVHWAGFGFAQCERSGGIDVCLELVVGRESLPNLLL